MPGTFMSRDKQEKPLLKMLHFPAVPKGTGLHCLLWFPACPGARGASSFLDKEVWGTFKHVWVLKWGSVVPRQLCSQSQLLSELKQHMTTYQFDLHCIWSDTFEKDNANEFIEKKHERKAVPSDAYPCIL